MQKGTTSIEAGYIGSIDEEIHDETGLFSSSTIIEQKLG